MDLCMAVQPIRAEDHPQMLIVQVANEAESIKAVQTLWLDYWHGLGLPGDFQGFEEELRTLPGKYAPPGGLLVIAYVDDAPAGTIAMRPLWADACEFKRLYVRPQFRRQRVASRLVEWTLDEARRLGYKTVHGDTLPMMNEAMQLYLRLGFRVMDHPYTNDPTPGAIYLELRIERSIGSKLP
jgi:GNAT superfamily N-acetyltransferase